MGDEQRSPGKHRKNTHTDTHQHTHNTTHTHKTHTQTQTQHTHPPTHTGTPPQPRGVNGTNGDSIQLDICTADLCAGRGVAWVHGELNTASPGLRPNHSLLAVWSGGRVEFTQ